MDTPTPDLKQEYAKLCILLGERQFLVMKLQSEIEELKSKLDKIDFSKFLKETNPLEIKQG